MRAVFALAALLAGLVASPASAQRFPDRYDPAIEAAARHYWPGVPWRLWKAQLWQESGLRADAVSPVGAKGIAQFMPATWAEITRAMGRTDVHPFLAEPAIEAGAFYMAQLRRHWQRQGAGAADTHRLAQASYNAGQGSIRRAARSCGPRGDGREFETDWAKVAECLPAITGKHAAETIGYVRQIARWFAMMEIAR
ncbi:MAG: transglycosylase SLT domain-containing protein [Tagaea sp.]|nr:transglycosylase SLT domain-containing protein [Tagaea sp.]